MASLIINTSQTREQVITLRKKCTEKLGKAVQKESVLNSILQEAKGSLQKNQTDL